MLKHHRTWLQGWRLRGVLVLVVSMAVLATTPGHATTALAVDTSGFEMSINISGCDEGTVTTKGGAAKCTLAPGSTFSVSYDLNTIPMFPDVDADGINGYHGMQMVSAFSGVQYKTGTLIALHGFAVLTEEPPLGPLAENGIASVIFFPQPCTPPDLFIAVCESDATNLTVWTAEFNCSASGTVELLPEFADRITIIGALALGFENTFLPEAKSIAVNCVPPVGGIAVDPDLSALRIETSDSAGVRVGLLVAIAVGGAAAVGAAGWYAWRRATS